MEPRTKSRTRFQASGLITYLPGGSTAGPWSYQTLNWTLHDFIKKSKDRLSGLTEPSDLSLLKTEIKVPFLDYTLSSQVDGAVFIVGHGIPGVPGGGLVPDSPPLGWASIEGTTAELTAKLLADTNPFGYKVSVPIMIAELVEAGSLLKLASNNFISLIGSSHLNWVFGWKPTIGDIKDLASITTTIENKILEFNKLLEKGGSRRRKFLNFGSDSGPEYDFPTHSLSGLGTWYGTVNTTFTSKVWGSVRWVPNRTSPIDLHKLTSFNEAMKIVLDLRVPDASTIWEAIPFSWLVDYFVNVGDALSAIEDTDKVLPVDICIMRERRITSVTKGIRKPEDDYPYLRKNSISGGLVDHVWKTREVVHPDSVGDLLSFGFMSKAQATNLLALLMSLARFKK